MRSGSKEPKALTALTLKSTLLEKNLLPGGGEFFCIDKSEKCMLHQSAGDGEYEGKVLFGDLKVYKLDESDNTYEVDFGRYKDHPVSLRFTIYPNGSSTQMIIEEHGKFYYLPTLFGKAVETESLDTAKDLWLENRKILDNSGDYY